jgi:hypothetical protein
MNSEQAKHIKVGNRVRWQSLDDDLPSEFGTVSETGFNAFKVEYDDGQVDTYKFNEPHRLCTVHLVKK